MCHLCVLLKVLTEVRGRHNGTGIITQNVVRKKKKQFVKMENIHGNVSVFMKLSSKKYSEANKGISTIAEVVPWAKAYLRRST